MPALLGLPAEAEQGVGGTVPEQLLDPGLPAALAALRRVDHGQTGQSCGHWRFGPDVRVAAAVSLSWEWHPSHVERGQRLLAAARIIARERVLVLEQPIRRELVERVPIFFTGREFVEETPAEREQLTIRVGDRVRHPG